MFIYFFLKFLIVLVFFFVLFNFVIIKFCWFGFWFIVLRVLMEEEEGVFDEEVDKGEGLGFVWER